MRVFRCSSLPMLLACGHSFDESELLIEGAHDAADLGTAAHDAMCSVVYGDHVDVGLIALRHGVQESELGPLVAYGRKAWEQLKVSFPHAATEVAVRVKQSGHALTGHIDVLSIVAGQAARFIDWKTGRKEEADYYPQLAGYAACLILGEGALYATASVVWLRSQTVETYTFKRADALALMERVKAALVATTPYRTGEHCPHCRRSHDCPALIATSRRDLAIFAQTDVDAELAQMSQEQIVSIRRRAKALTSFAESLDKSIRRRVAVDGPLDSGDGYALSLVEENGKRSVDTLKAWPILQERLTDEELAECVTVSASAVDDAVAKKAGRGKGAEAKRQIAAELGAVGAVTQGKVVKLKEVRLPKQIETEEEAK